MVKYKIIDNFLSDADFSTLTNNISPLPLDSPYPVAKPSFGWDYTHCQLKEFNEEAKGWVKSTTNDEQDRFKKVTDIQVLDPIHDWYMQHMVQTGNYYSNAMQYFGALLGRINPLALFQIRANLTVQQEKRGRTIFHIDYKGAHATSMITSIFDRSAIIIRLSAWNIPPTAISPTSLYIFVTIPSCGAEILALSRSSFRDSKFAFA